jgi:urea transport system permease protein
VWPQPAFRRRPLSLILLLFFAVAGAVLFFSRSALAGTLTAEDLKKLGEDDFDSKAEAISRIAAAGDLSDRRLLEAVRDGNAFVASDGRILILVDHSYLDPLTGNPAEVKPDDLQEVTLNNILREQIAGALGALNLKSPDVPTRAAAIQALFDHADPALKPQIDAARQMEKNSTLKARLDQLWAMTDLQDPDPKKRVEAVQLIGRRGDPQLRGLLAPIVQAKPDGTFTEQDAAVRSAAAKAIGDLNFAEWKIQMTGTVFAGLSLGSVLLLAALGLAITYGLIGVINMAHGEFIMIGAYATYLVQQWFQQHWSAAFDWYPAAAVPASFLAASAAGFILERTILRFLYQRPLETLLATFGISLILIQSTRMVFGAQNVQVSNPSWMNGGVMLLPNLILPFNRIAIMIFALCVVSVAWLVLNKTRLGLFIRATTQNRTMASCSGVRTWQVDSYAFAFGAGIAGLGGCALSQIGNVGPDLGQTYIIDSFMTVVLGGVGQLTGTIVGALGLGLVSKVLEPFWGAVLAKIAILVFIVLFIQKRPRGLFALKGRSAEL